METQTQSRPTNKDLGTLANDARALMVATADVAESKVNEARVRLATAVDNSKKILGRAREKALAGVKTADQAVHEHPYQAIGISLGMGALIGYLVARRYSGNGGD